MSTVADFIVELWLVPVSLLILLPLITLVGWGAKRILSRFFSGSTTTLSSSAPLPQGQN